MLKGGISGVVFDLDGTLIDSLSVSLAAFNHGIVSAGGREHTPVEIMRYFGPGEGEIFSRIVGPEKAEKAFVAYRKYTDEHLGKVPLHGGIEDLLSRLKTQGIPVSIFTGRSWETTELILNHLDILGDFVTVVASDHVNQSKPSPEGLELALGRMKLGPEQGIFVGDSWADMRAAQALGCRSIAAVWDLLADRDSMTPFQPTHWADSPGAVWNLLAPSP